MRKFFPLWVGAMIAAVMGMAALAPVGAEEKSRSPFHRSPADVAVEEPCRFMGTFHKEVRQRLDQSWHGHVKIFVSGGLDPQRLQFFRAVGGLVDGFGVGSAISGAGPIDFTADIKEVDNCPVAKRGRMPGIVENPRLQRLLLNP